MKRRARKAAEPEARGDPRGMRALLATYIEALRVQNYSEATQRDRTQRVGYFVAWCEERGLTRPEQITKPIVERYQRWVFYHRKADGKPLGTRSQYWRVAAVKAYFRWLARQNYIASNPASEVAMPRLGKPLPKDVLTAREAEAVLAQPDTQTLLGVRDRAMLEVLYSTGVRRMELLRLAVTDVDAGRGVVLVREGKGKRDRVVPIGERALVWVDRYLAEVRGELVCGADEGRLFVSNAGEPFAPDYLTELVRRYVVGAGVGKSGSCHLFRHTCATVMLEGGADIRFIQQMLGHAQLETTQMYTHVSIGALKAVHTASHPARVRRKPEGAKDPNGEES